MMGVSKKPQQGKLENIYNRIKTTREFTRICCQQLKLLSATRYSVRHILLTPSSVTGHLDCFHVLPIVNSAALGTPRAKGRVGWIGRGGLTYIHCLG